MRFGSTFRPLCPSGVGFPFGVGFQTGVVLQIGVALLMSIGWYGSVSRGAAPLGEHLDDFSLPTARGRAWSLHEVADQKLVVITFLGTECPLAQLYVKRLADLYDRWHSQGVAFIAVDSNVQDSLTELSAFAERHQVPFPVLKDPDQSVANRLSAKRTPEVVVLDADRVVRYHGRIDDQYGIGYAREKPQQSFLNDALENLLAGREVPLSETESIGCLIGRSQRVAPSGDITYTQHIAKIFNQRCVECHRAGEVAPFVLTSYDDVVGWQDTLLEVIEENRMPPWTANPAHGKFANDARLTPEEKQTIRDWIAHGMPEGNPQDLPTPPQWVTGWRIPQPDQILEMRDTPYQVPADGVVDYQYFVVDPGWKEDKYIYAAEARPDSRAVVHHILVYILGPHSQQHDPRTILVGYAPGSTPIHLTDGMAIHVPANSRLLFQMHYTPNGEVHQDKSYVGVCFLDSSKVTQLLHGRLAINEQFRIPAEADNHVVTAEYRSSQDEWLQSMTPHMHLRGKSFRYEATFPDGKTEVLLDVPRYDFNWQMKYILAEPKLLPKGTRILCTASYDNSAQNLSNPDPTRDVRWGDQSWEEMMIGFFDVVPAPPQAPVVKSRNVKLDPTGTWKWRRPKGSETVEDTLRLRLVDDELSGEFSTEGKTVPIQAAAVVEDQLEFRLQIPDLPGLVIDFQAKILAEELQGQVTFNLATVGKSQSFPWNPHRAAAAGN